jgi:hypothetical protein
LKHGEIAERPVGLDIPAHPARERAQAVAVSQLAPAEQRSGHDIAHVSSA